MALLLAEERFLKIKQVVDEEQNQPEVMQELMLKLLNDLKNYDGILLNQEEQAVQKEQEEQAAKSFTLYRNFSMIDDVKVLQDRENLMKDIQTFLRKFSQTEKSSVENLVPIPSEFKGISEDICDVPSCDHFDAECGLINSLLSRDILIASLNIDFLTEEFAGELDFIDPILPGINEDDFDEEDFDEEEGEIDIDILQIEDEILREKLLNVNLLIDKIEALNLTPFVLEYPSFSPISVVDREFLIEEVDTFLVLEDSISPGIENDLGSEENIIFLDDLLNDDPILEYEHFTFNIKPDAPVINNFDELNEDECFDPGRGEINVSQNVEDNDSFTFVIRTFLPYLTYPDYPDIEDSRVHGTDIKEMDKIKAKNGQSRTREGKSAQEPGIIKSTLVNNKSTKVNLED
ncbi:hypothetical protein Tco_0231723 [Tanacetum coccineum]